jgi:hypothetical protein
LAEDETAPSLEDEVRGLNGRGYGTCAVCEWIAARDDADEWDRLMAMPSKDIQHQALGVAMRKRGFTRSDHRIGAHRREQHRVG